MTETMDDDDDAGNDVGDYNGGDDADNGNDDGGGGDEDGDNHDGGNGNETTMTKGR